MRVPRLFNDPAGPATRCSGLPDGENDMTDTQSIKNEIAEFLDRKAIHLDDSQLLSDLVPDSFLLVELYVHLQHKFGVEISSDEAAVIGTVGELAERIANG